MRRFAPLAVALALAACAPSPWPDGEDLAAVRALGLTDAELDRVVDLHLVLEGPAAAASFVAGAPVERNAKRTRQRLAELKVLRDDVRPRLAVLGVPIVGELSRVANAFHVRAPRRMLPQLKRLPHVVGVYDVPIHERGLLSAVPVVGAPKVWTATTPYLGEGIRIGIADTGIDYFHADFGGSGAPADYDADDRTIIEPGSFPTARVIGGWDFAGDAYDAGSNNNATPVPDPDPNDCNRHGTHVAGIAAGSGVLTDGSPFAGPYVQSLDRAEFLVGPGVAPKAELYALKVFGCNGSTSLTALALDRAADPDQNGDLSDRLEIVNASLGSPYGNLSPVATMAVENYTAVGGLFVVAAGNDGNTFFITGSPGNTPPGLSVAASNDVDFVALNVDSPASIAGEYAAAEGGFTVPLVTSGAITGELARTVPNLACSPITNPAEIAGKIALIDRGNCLFVEKVAEAEAAGAIAVVVVQSVATEPPFAMGGSAPTTLPGVMIGRDDGDIIKAELDGGVTITLDSADRFDGVEAELMAGFSSRGPSSFQTMFKPELAAPGVSVDSAAVGSGTGAVRLQGTSMATPMVAGAAALVREANPSFDPELVKALLINTTTPVRRADGEIYPLSMQGSGRINVDAAVSRTVTAALSEPGGLVAVSFGEIVSYEIVSESREILVRNHGAEAVSYRASTKAVQPLDGVSSAVAPAEFSVEPGGAATVTVTLTLDPFALGAPARDPFTPASQFDLPRHHLNEATGHVVLDDEAGAQSITLPFYAVVRAATDRSAGAPYACPDATGLAYLPIVGTSAHPAPLVSAFQLGVESELFASPVEGGGVADLVAIGAMSNLASVGSLVDSTMYFAVAVAGSWPTPAPGQLPAVGVEIDIDSDEVADYRVTPEPFEADEPFGDVLTAATFDLVNGGVVGRRFLNIASAGEGDTQPFHNSVMVLPAFASDIGLTDDAPTFRYRAFATGLITFLATDVTDWADYDAANPAVDTTGNAPTPGWPLYGLDQPIVVRWAPDTQPPPLMLVHHANVLEQRYQIVSIGEVGAESIRLNYELPETVEPGGRILGKINVTNDGAQAVRTADIVAEVQGARIDAAASSHGLCDLEGAASCALGRLEPGASVVVTLVLIADSASPPTIDARVTSDLGCVTELTAAVSLGDPADRSAPLDAAGGCGCRIVGQSATPAPVAYALVALAAFALQRRRRRTKPAPLDLA